MYGYIRAYKPELKFREYDTYQGYYCGLCHTLQKEYGFPSRLTLSYDLTFLIMVLQGVYETPTQIVEKSCFLHPIHKKKIVENEVFSYGAAMSVLLSYEKCQDDWMDEHNLAKKAYGGCIASPFQKAAEQYPRQKQAITKQLQCLHEMEQQQESNLDAPAGAFGELLGELFAWKEDIWYDTLKRMGFYLGKFIYWADAWHDMAHDAKKHCYNPLLAAGMTEEQVAEMMPPLLEQTLGHCAMAFERLPILENIDILKNIMYAGIWNAILPKNNRNDNEKRG